MRCRYLLRLVALALPPLLLRLAPVGLASLPALLLLLLLLPLAVGLLGPQELAGRLLVPSGHRGLTLLLLLLLLLTLTLLLLLLISAAASGHVLAHLLHLLLGTHGPADNTYTFTCIS